MSELKLNANIDQDKPKPEHVPNLKIIKESKCLYATTVVILFFVTLFQKYVFNDSDLNNIPSPFFQPGLAAANWVNFKMNFFLKQLPIHVVFFICSYIWPTWGIKVYGMLERLVPNYYYLVIVCNVSVTFMALLSMAMVITMILGCVNISVILCELFNVFLFSHVLYCRYSWPSSSYPWWQCDTTKTTKTYTWWQNKKPL
jgi:hypothetical protein